MYIYIEDAYYGADEDGNRGGTLYGAELTEDDFDDVRDAIINQYDADVKWYTIELYDRQFDLYAEFEVNILDYFDAEELAEL